MGNIECWFDTDRERLLKACGRGDIDTVKYLLDIGVNPNGRNGGPLFQAVYNDCFEVVKYLLEKGADASINNYRVLTWAAKSARPEITKLLVRDENSKQIALTILWRVYSENKNKLNFIFKFENNLKI
jgi:ankyrin repeat protein